LNSETTGTYDRADAIADNAASISLFGGMSTAPAFWRFYAPVMDQLLQESVAAYSRKLTQQ